MPPFSCFQIFLLLVNLCPVECIVHIAVYAHVCRESIQVGLYEVWPYEILHIYIDTIEANSGQHCIQCDT